MARFSFGPMRASARARDQHHAAANDGPHISAGSARPGPGWYDSSWDLRCGLEVREGLPADATVYEWLEDVLRR